MSIVLLGQIGTGRTTLYNKITLSQEKTKGGGDSVTLNVFIKKSCFGSGFSVIDTPGFGSDQNKLDHIAGVLAALSEGPLNRIFIVISYKRINLIIKEVQTIIPAFINYRHMITILISFWDLCEKENEAETKKEIQQELAKLKINSTMFVGRYDIAESICQQIDQIMATSKAENVNLTQKDIFQNLDLTDYEEWELFEIDLIQQDLKHYYDQFVQRAKILIRENNISKGLQADFFYALIQFAKQILEETLRKFENKTLYQIDEINEKVQLKAFKIYLQFKNYLFEEYKNIIDIAHEQIYKGKHFSKYIRKCYHCGQIWFQVTGCEGQTVCGRLNDNHQDEFIQQEEAPQKFIVTYQQGRLEVKPSKQVEQQVVVLNEQNKYNLMANENSKNHIKKMTLGTETFNVSDAGCGRIIEWGKMKPLTEQEMNQILGILDERFFNEMVSEIELKYIQYKALNIYQNERELNRKILEQKNKIKYG